MVRKSKYYLTVGVVSAIVLYLFTATVMASAVNSPKDLYYSVAEKTSFHGFLQQGFSWNTEDPQETTEDDQWKVSMIRSTLYGDIYSDWDWSKWTIRFRYDMEHPNSYMDRLQDLPNTFDPVTNYKIDIYDEVEDFDVREWFVDFQIGQRNFLRLGKQQVVWGKTDFFSGLDIVHGYDYRWRSFLEAENEQRRKPLIMANLQTEFHEIGSSLQLIFRPGWDRKKDIGNTYDLYGGRWANQPNKGNNFLAPLVTPYNYEHEEGDYQDPTYGVRWNGTIGGFEYTLNYLHSFFQDPVVNPNADNLALLGLTGAEVYKEVPNGYLGDLLYKQVDIAGVTATYYVAPIDIIVRCEASYTWDAPYNYDKDFGFGTLPGFAGVMEKDTVRLMGGFDRNVKLAEKLLGSERPGFLSMQIFDTWLMDYEKDEELLYLVGYGKERKEHETIGTIILSWYYDYDQIVPTVAAGYDFSNGGGFFIPSLKFAYGDHWRLLFEYDMFFGGSGKDAGEVEDDCAIFGYFDNNDQLYLRLTYQF